MRSGKFNARQVKEDGYTFASKMEHKRYCDLKLMLKGKIIEGLIVHPKFKAIVNGVKVCDVILDFQYFDKTTKKLVYEDVKGFDPPMSKLKRRLLKALFPEVEVLLLTAR